MSKFKLPKEFDYDLFKNSEGKFFARLKRTGDVSEVTIEVFRFLRKEAMDMYRKQEGIPVYGKRDGKSVVTKHVPLLFIDTEINKDSKSNWLIDPNNTEDSIIVDMTLEEFKKTLTKKQLDILNNCLLEKVSMSQYSKIIGISKQSVYGSVLEIRKKYKKFF